MKMPRTSTVCGRRATQAASARRRATMGFLARVGPDSRNVPCGVLTSNVVV